MSGESIQILNCKKPIRDIKEGCFMVEKLIYIFPEKESSVFCTFGCGVRVIEMNNNSSFSL